ncbi:MAG: type II toxin-antitoxin system VapC family toxin [Blastochloris sp.]|nr:type II toxin-antitoxin system VapC family toxin [Blastochloris sp.]
MSRIILLDAGPPGLLSQPRSTPTSLACRQWAVDLTTAGAHLHIAEIADYEVRRELLRAGKQNGLRRLDTAGRTLDYLPLTTAMLRRVAELWAELRRQGLSTADARAIDADAILAAQALLTVAPGDMLVIATTNVGHLSRIVPAQRRQDIVS